MQLDDQALDAILSSRSPYIERSCDGTKWLNLDDFTHASDDVLERLAASIQSLEGISLGFNRLSPRAAKLLLGINIEFFCLTRLHSLDEQAAFILGTWPFDYRPIRILKFEKPITASVAASLVGEPPPENNCDRPLDISVPSITLPVAQALSRQTHELYLTVRDETISRDVAMVLSAHAGHSLTLSCDCGFSDEILLELSGNPGKRFRKRSQWDMAYVVNHDMWASIYEN